MKLPNIVMKANVLVACLISMAVVTPSFAGYDNSCVGTYYLHEASGNTSLWTFEKDGTMLSVSSAQQQFNFTNAQGNWNSAYDSSAIVKMFDYTLGNPASASSIVRVDAKWKRLSLKLRSPIACCRHQTTDPRTERVVSFRKRCVSQKTLGLSALRAMSD